MPAKKTTASKLTKKERMGLSTSQFNEVLDFLETVPELQEAYTRADIELALDDRGWLVGGRQYAAADLDSQTRTTMVAKSRLYWARDPLAKQAIRLWTDYTLGADGVTYKAKDDGVQKTLDLFMKHRRNKSLTGSEGQRRNAKKLLVDGEVFFVMFANKDVPEIRRVDCLQITDIICDPDDDEHVLGYRRQTAADKTMYYADWRCTDEDLTMLGEQKDPQTKGTIGSKVEKDVKMYHIPFDTLLKRGNGLLFSVVDWSKEHRRFMEARVAITQALAKFAWKGEVQGGQSVIDNLRKQLESSLVSTGAVTTERHPPNVPASTWLSNKGVSMTPMPRSTGAGDAEGDGNQLKLMFCAGTGIMLHYLGDPSTGNLATATAMELPMLKMFASFQKLWIDVYRDLFSIALEEDIDSDPAVIDIDLPPILADDLQKLGTFLTAMASVFPEIKVPEVLQMCLISLGVNNIDQVMKATEEQRAKNDAAAAELLKRPPAPGDGAPLVAGPPSPTTESLVKFAEAVNILAELMK